MKDEETLEKGHRKDEEYNDVMILSAKNSSTLYRMVFLSSRRLIRTTSNNTALVCAIQCSTSLSSSLFTHKQPGELRSPTLSFDRIAHPARLWLAAGPHLPNWARIKPPATGWPMPILLSIDAVECQTRHLPLDGLTAVRVFDESSANNTKRTLLSGSVCFREFQLWMCSSEKTRS